MRKEYGGCLPREMFLASSPNAIFPEWVPRVSSGRAGIYFAILDSGCHTVYLPYYTCPTIKEFIVEHGIQVKEYHLCSNYEPNIGDLSEGEILLWTNYYGCMLQDTIDKVVKKYRGRLILDCCHAFFMPPISDIYIIYGVRKFVGVSSGTFLYHSKYENTPPHFGQVLKPAIFDEEYLDISLHNGSNAAYALYRTHSAKFHTVYGEMDPAVQQQLKKIDFPAIKDRRKENFLALHQTLKEKNGITLDFLGNTAFMYPFYTTDAGLRQRLLEHNVFTPVWWKRVLSLPDATDFERDIVQHIIPIPMDQRYTPEEMEELGQFILDELR